MPILPASLPKVEVNAAKVAYAHETLDMIQAEAFISECAYRRYMAATRPLEVHMMRKREILERARAAFQDLCAQHEPRITLRYSLPVSCGATSFKPTSFTPNPKGHYTRG
jgi:hypothetical protein